MAIEKFDTALKARIRKLAYTSYFKGGVHLIPIAQVPDADEILKAAIPDASRLVDQAVRDVSDAHQRNAASGWATLANVADYPSRGTVPREVLPRILAT